MNIIRQSHEIISKVESDEILRVIELAGRTCYRTEGNIYVGSAPDFIRKRIATGHHSVIEHANVTVRIITDRGVTHEIVRHRLASYSQESTRYCNYSKDKFGKEITVILPVWFYDEVIDDQLPSPSYIEWYQMMKVIERTYFKLLEFGQSPQQARSVLPNSLKTEIIMTCNIREWRHFFTLRTSTAAHPQMRDLALGMLEDFKKSIPVLFENII